MILKQLTLTYFKNHKTSSFDFADSINCIVGNNGTGKTSLLDAIYYLSCTKSALNTQDKHSITHEQSFFTLYGVYDNFTIAIQFERGKTKTLKIDGRVLDKLSDIIGKAPIVMVLPNDISIIKGGSDERRKFFDGAVSQFDQTYLKSLLNYNRILKQRNSLLKTYEDRPIKKPLMDTYDEQLMALARQISKRRAEVVQVFLPFLENNYRDLHEGTERPSLCFKTHVNDEFETAFKQNFPNDQLMQRTLMGAHRDDFQFLLDDVPIKTFGSQGQLKTFILALKLALYDFLKEQTKMNPLLLMDDIFDKLDDIRILYLVKLLENNQRFGQIFITDSSNKRCRKLFDKNKNTTFFEL